MRDFRNNITHILDLTPYVDVSQPHVAAALTSDKRGQKTVRTSYLVLILCCERFLSQQGIQLRFLCKQTEGQAKNF